MKPLGAADPAAVGSYRLLGVLGGGGMGRVYLGESRTGRRVAVKVIRAELADDAVFRRRFSREVKASRAVSPLYTAAVVDADPSAELPWLATTYIAGPSLTELVGTEGPLPPAAVLTLAAGLSDALASIHRVGLVHRDLKPSNVIIDDAGPHIIDFGIALTTETTRITTSILVGTPSYIAPEIIFRNESGPASDVFSLGATLVFAASGKHLIADGTMYAQVMQITTGKFDLEAVPKELRPLVVRCISPEPRDRPTADELARILVASGIPAPSPGWYTTSAPAPQVAIPPGRTTAARSGGLGGRGLSRRSLLAFGGVVSVAAAAGSGIGVGAGLFERSAEDLHSAWQPPPSPAAVGSASPTAPGPRRPGDVLWQARSGVTPSAATAGAHPSGIRIIVDPRGLIIAANGSEVYAVDIDGDRLWATPFPTGPLNLRQWGDAVLVSDSRTLWLLNAADGTEIFTVKAVDDEDRASRNDNPDGVAVEVGAGAIAADRVFVGLGTATIAINRQGGPVWREPRPPRRNGRRPPSGAPLAAGGTWLLTHDKSDTVVQLGLRNAGNGDVTPRWPIEYTVEQLPAGPPPGPGGPPDDAGWHRSEGRIGTAHVVVRDMSQVRAFALGDGRQVWSKPPQMPIAAIEVVGDLVLVAADRLTAYRIADGSSRWSVDLRGARIAPTVDGKTIIVATDQTVSALSLTGSQLWRTSLESRLGDASIDRLTVSERVGFLTFRSQGEQVQPLDIDVVAVALDTSD